MSDIKKTIVVLTTAIWLSGVVALLPMTARAITAAELQTQINALLAQIQTLQNQLAALQGTPTGYTFSVNLKMGDRGTDVTNLQTVLKSDVSVYPEGLVTGYFGVLTKAAAVRFQEKYAAEILTPLGLTSGTGYVGASTRAKLNALYGGGVVTPAGVVTPGVVTPAGTGLTVAAAAVQPTATIAPEGAARIPFTKVVFTAGSDGDVVVNGVVVERTGLAQDAVFAGIVLLDENGVQLGIEKTLNSEHRATVGEAFTVAKGQSKTMTIAGNMLTGSTALDAYAGQVAYLSVVGANTSATVTGNLPITGAGHTINATLSIGSVTTNIGVTDPGTSATKEIGTTGYTFTAIRLTAGSAEKVRVKSVRWYQSGSAASSDLENVKTYVDGVAYATTISADGKYYTSTFDGGVVIDKGNTVELAVKGDIAGGSARTVDFDIYKRTDVYAAGETYGYGITPPNGTDEAGTDDGAFHLTTNPWFDAYQATVSSGTLNVQKASSVAAQNIAINLANQPLGGFTVEAKGEAISVANMVFRFTITDSDAGGEPDGVDVDSVSLYDENGAVVAGPVDATGSAESGVITLTDTVTFPVGKKTYTLKGKIMTDFENNDTIAASTTPSTDWTTVTGQVTGNTITPSPTSAVTGNTMTVKSTSLTISVSPDPIAQTVVTGGRFTFANYRFDASGSGEDIRMAVIPLAYHAPATPTFLTSCQLFDGATALNTGSNIVNPSAAGSSTSITFDGNGLTVPKGTVKTLALKCDIAGNATGSYAWGVDSGATFAGTGLTSGQSFTPTATDSLGQLMTLASAGTLAVSLDTASSPSYTLVAGGTTGNRITVLKFHATNEAISLQKVALQLTGTASNSPQDLVKATLWDGTTQVGEAIFITDYATSTLSSAVLIPKDGDKLITVKVDLAAIGSSLPGTEGAWLKVDYDDSDSTGTQGIGQNSGTTISRSSSSDTATAGLRVFKSFPTLTKLTAGSTKMTAGNLSLYRFKVTADSAGAIGVGKFTVRVATSSATAGTKVDNLNMYAYTDSGFSQSVVGIGNSGELLQTALDTDLYWSSSSRDFEFSPLTTASASTTIQVSAGGSVYFEVRGDVTVAGATYSVSTQIQGDANYFATSTNHVDTYTVVDNNDESTGDNDFIWSPNSTTTNTTNGNDWTNGYGVLGLPSSNMTAEILTQ